MEHWLCPSCGRDYAYELSECSWCRVSLDAVSPSSARIIGITEVSTPSDGHEDVPYWCALLEAEDGSHAVQKLGRELRIGETISFTGKDEAELAVIGVLGTGVMGRGLVELLLGQGHQVVWCGRSTSRLAASRDKLITRLGRVMDEDQVQTAVSRLTVSSGYEPLGQCDVVLEAIIEEAEAKKRVLAGAESHMRADAILTSNTSGLSVEDLAAALERPANFGVLHFFNPATRMRLVETAVCEATSESTSTYLDDFARSLGKVPIRVAAKPAFAVNRALMPLLNEAVRELEESVASAEAIDEAVRLGLNHPMGPLALADLIGLDVVVNIMENLAERTDDATYSPRPLLRRLVAEGKLGRKTGQGFFTYSDVPRTA